MSKLIMSIYAGAAFAVSIGAVAAMLIAPPQSLRSDRDGVPHFTSLVEHPETGDAISIGTLIRHYRGD
ncbi:hypothetical protein V5T82_04440 [Magnetovibrio sp. PR-2]|uniref:hypothetical protein n=1 Tax=Magnetovibrio sp. PR-2 TaxID=3120356 RepID=UPI002FCDE686